MNHKIGILLFLVISCVSSCVITPEDFNNFTSQPVSNDFEKRLNQIIPNSEYVENEKYTIIKSEITSRTIRDVTDLISKSFYNSCGRQTHGTAYYFASEGEGNIDAPRISNDYIEIKLPDGSRLERLSAVKEDFVCAVYDDTDSVQGRKLLSYKKYIKVLGQFDGNSNQAVKLYIISLKDEYIQKYAILPAIEKYKMSYNQALDSRLEKNKNTVYHLEYSDGSNDFRFQCGRDCERPHLTYVFNNKLGSKSIQKRLNDIGNITKDGKSYTAAWLALPNGNLATRLVVRNSLGKSSCTLVNNNFEVIINPNEECIISLSLAISGLELTTDADYTMTVNGITRKLKVKTLEDYKNNSREFMHWGGTEAAVHF